MLNTHNLKIAKHYKEFGDGICGCHICREKRLQEDKAYRQLIKWVVIGIVLLMASVTLCHAEDVDLAIISNIESGGHAHAYNSHSGAVGLYQITPICLKDYNASHKQHLTMKDVYYPLYADMVANWYLNYKIPKMLSIYGIEDNIRNRLIAYNWGIGHMKNDLFIPKETIDYINKYKRLSQ